MKRLRDLARACHDGACNGYALAVELGEATREAGLGAVRTVEYKYALGHLSFLAGESMGPSPEVVSEFSDSLDAESAVKPPAPGH